MLTRIAFKHLHLQTQVKKQVTLHVVRHVAFLA